MKKIMTMMLGLSLLAGTASLFAKDDKMSDTTKTTKTKKAKKMKKTDTTSTTK